MKTKTAAKKPRLINLFVLIPRKHKGKKKVFLADPNKVAAVVTTDTLAKARTYSNRNNGYKFLRRHKDLKRQFRCTRAVA